MGFESLPPQLLTMCLRHVISPLWASNPPFAEEQPHQISLPSFSFFPARTLSPTEAHFPGPMPLGPINTQYHLNPFPLPLPSSGPPPHRHLSQGPGPDPQSTHLCLPRWWHTAGGQVMSGSCPGSGVPGGSCRAAGAKARAEPREGKCVSHEHFFYGNSE